VNSVDGEDTYERLAHVRALLSGAENAREWLRVSDPMAHTLQLRGKLERAATLLTDAVDRHQAPENEWVRPSYCGAWR